MVEEILESLALNGITPAYIDLDGVVYDWAGAAQFLLEDRLGRELHASNGWDDLERQVSPDDWKWLWNERSKEMFLIGDPIPGALEGLKNVYNNFGIVFVSKRPVGTEEVTKLWLRLQGIDYDSLLIVGKGSKSSTLPTPPAWFVDDKPDNIKDALEGWGLSRERVFLFDQPWNRDFDYPNRVLNWDALVEAAFHD